MSRLRVLFGGIVVAALCSSCVPWLLYQDQVPDFKAPADKALCVVMRPMGLYGGNVAKIWLDGKPVAGTSGNTVTSFEVEPGEHLVLTKISIMTKVKFNFQAGKVYYLMQAVFPIPMVGVSTSLTPMPGDEAVARLKEEQGKLKYSTYNPAAEEKQMDADDVKEEFEDWDKWAKKEPEKAKVEIEYPGY